MIKSQSSSHKTKLIFIFILMLSCFHSFPYFQVASWSDSDADISAPGTNWNAFRGQHVYTLSSSNLYPLNSKLYI